ncbi:MAG: hypothetical protein V2A67_10930 [Bacteroidota bacterium]
MKTLNLAVIVMILLLWGCDRETLQPAIQLDNATDCKGPELKSIQGITTTQDCIQYEYQDNILTIKHVNAGFNCCPQGFNVNLAVSGDTLIISETENSSMCDCCCLFDLDYTLTDIGNRTWWIRVNEPYVQGPDEEKILFQVNLKLNPSGEKCFERSGYPWN